MDPGRHDSWATEAPAGYERGEHNRGGTRWTLHALGHDPEFLKATAHHPLALRVVEGLIGGPVKLPGRNRVRPPPPFPPPPAVYENPWPQGIYAIFPQSQAGNLGPHVDSHTFECQMVRSRTLRPSRIPVVPQGTVETIRIQSCACLGDTCR